MRSSAIVTIALAFIATMAVSPVAAYNFVHPESPHIMSKNSFALPSQTDQYETLKTRIGTIPLMVILLEFPDSNHNAAHTAAYFDDLIFGADPSVNGYFKEISYGKFSFENAGVKGWFMAPEPASYYFDSSQTERQYTTLAAVAVQQAINAGGQFKSYDQNGDGKITREELLILIPLADHRSWNQPYSMATRFDQTVAQGVTTPDGLEIDTWAIRVEENIVADDRRNYITFFSHELAHIALSLPDLYGDNYGEDPAGTFSLMALSYTDYTPHISPWAKIHLGWINPIVVTEDGLYEIKSVEDNPEAYILYNPDHGVDEYFIIENRWPSASTYESHGDNFINLDRGLAIWHITEFYDDEQFSFLKGRKMVGMKWAGGDGSLDNLPYTALWDCFEYESCYDLTENSTPRNSRWQDGTSSGIEIKDISTAGETMFARLSIVPSSLPDGCTPGYWKHPQHEDSWLCYSMDDSFDEVFGVNSTFRATSLAEVLAQGGGGEKAFARHAVAALLNACMMEYDSSFEYSRYLGEVINAVRDAYETGEFELTRKIFASDNEKYCPLN